MGKFVGELTQPYQVYFAVRWILATSDLARVRRWTVADDLGISTTMLRRRLHAGGTSYGVMLRQERFGRLMALLNTATVPLYGHQVADAVCLVGESSGYRLFHEYMGISLRAYNQKRFGHCAPRVISSQACT